MRYLLLLILLLIPLNVQAVDLCSAANPNDNNSDSTALQACLNNGGDIQLANGSPGYIINAGLQIVTNNTSISSVDPGHPATLIAHPDLVGPMFSADDAIQNFTYQITYLIIDGNKINRTTGCNNEWPDRPNHSNFDMRGDGYVIDHVTSKNVPCGTGMMVLGSNFTVSNSIISDNGYSTSGQSPQGSYMPWADGITVGWCDNGYIHHNTVNNSSDLGIVVGGTAGNGCRVEYNQINQTTMHAFAGIGWAFFGDTSDPQGGNYENASMKYNTVTSSLNMTDQGISVGSWGWFGSGLIHGGQVTNNSSTGARINLDIYGITNMTVIDNTMSNPQGSFAGYSANYYVSKATNSCLQPGWVVKAVIVYPPAVNDTGENITSNCTTPAGTWPHEPPYTTVPVDCPYTDYCTGQLHWEYGEYGIISDPTAPMDPPGVHSACVVSGAPSGGGGPGLQLGQYNTRELYWAMWFKRDFDTMISNSGYNKFVYTKHGPYTAQPQYWVSGQWMGYYADWLLIYDMQTPDVNNCHIPSEPNIPRGDSYCSIIGGRVGIPKNIWTLIEVYMMTSDTPSSQNGKIHAWVTPSGGSTQVAMWYDNVNLPGPFTEFIVTQTWASANGIDPVQTSGTTWCEFEDHLRISIPVPSSTQPSIPNTPTGFGVR